MQTLATHLHGWATHHLKIRCEDLQICGHICYKPQTTRKHYGWHVGLVESAWERNHPKYEGNWVPQQEVPHKLCHATVEAMDRLLEEGPEKEAPQLSQIGEDMERTPMGQAE